MIAVPVAVVAVCSQGQKRFFVFFFFPLLSLTRHKQYGFFKKNQIGTLDEPENVCSLLSHV